MDPTQLLLTLVLATTTIFLLIVGIQLIFLLRELRKTLKNANSIIDGFKKIGFSVDSGFKEIAGFLIGIKTIIKLIDSVTKSKK